MGRNAKLRATESRVEPPEPSLPMFTYDVVKVDSRGCELSREQKAAQYIQEDLGNGVSLDMVLIPGGCFLMGSPDDELECRYWEGPQHEVTVASFLMGRYPVTQRQWYAVSLLDNVARELKPDPSHFKGANRPVEQVSWHDAVEFCQRLSLHTGREYRLPSEAEREYSCRARTTTSFHFGETLTSELANYSANYTYGDGPKGEYRKQTTEVGSFPANAFGLYDMHGNVWEWCEDCWHGNYERAPTDGIAWTEGGNAKRRILRGGAWDFNPRNCCSAYRFNGTPDYHISSVGFRVSCAAPRALA